MASYLNFRKETLAFRDFCSHKEFEKKTQLRDGVNEKKKFSFGHCPNHLNQKKGAKNPGMGRPGVDVFPKDNNI